MNIINKSSTIGVEYSLDCVDDKYVIIKDFTVDILSVMSILFNSITYPNQPICINLKQYTYDLDDAVKKKEVEELISNVLSSQIPGIGDLSVVIESVKTDDDTVKNIVRLEISKNPLFNMTNNSGDLYGMNVFNNTVKLNITLNNEDVVNISLEQ